MQLSLAIGVAREFLCDKLADESPTQLASGRSIIQDLVSEIKRLAVEAAGRKVAKRYGLHVADAIEPRRLPPGPFWIKRRPRLKRLMSAAYAQGITPPAQR